MQHIARDHCGHDDFLLQMDMHMCQMDINMLQIDMDMDIMLQMQMAIRGRPYIT